MNLKIINNEIFFFHNSNIQTPSALKKNKIDLKA